MLSDSISEISQDILQSAFDYKDYSPNFKDDLIELCARALLLSSKISFTGVPDVNMRSLAFWKQYAGRRWDEVVEGREE